jgi:hypothetical protein
MDFKGRMLQMIQASPQKSKPKRKEKNLAPSCADTSNYSVTNAAPFLLAKKKFVASTD